MCGLSYKGLLTTNSEILNMNTIKQPESSIYSKVNLEKPLSDVRPRRYGLHFGTVRGICKQFGIKIVNHGNYNEFTAPKLRLQLFMEKLHFSLTPYSRQPPKSTTQ